MTDETFHSITEEDMQKAAEFEEAARVAGFEPAKLNTFAQAGECVTCHALVYKRGWLGHQQWHRANGEGSE
jgi:molybdenum cofactor biosynthesis enzyme MoaA